MGQAQSFHEILKNLLEKESFSPEVPSENPIFPQQNWLFDAHFSLEMTDFALARGPKSYGIKARSRFERRAKPTRAPLKMPLDRLTSMEHVALLCLYNSEAPAELCEDDVRRRFRQLALYHHPDRNTGDAEIFRQVREAYEVLRQALTRHQDASR